MLKHFDMAGSIKQDGRKLGRRVLCAAVTLALASTLVACGNKEKKPGQALASVNGDEITVLQLNEELQRAGVTAGQQEAASKQLLEALIDRQLLQNEAAKEKIDRDPKVLQAIERAKALIVAQAYMQKRIGTVARPTKEEVADYYQKNPDFFSRRKQFDMLELVMATRDVDDNVKAAIDHAKSLDEVSAWLDAHQLRYSRAQLSRTSADLPPAMNSKLLGLPKGQLFIIREGDRSLLVSIADIKDSPVNEAAAAPQIEQFLFNKRNKDAADAEIARLRAAAKIEYLNKAADKTAPAAADAAPAASAPAAAPAAADAASNANERGVAGLK